MDALCGSKSGFWQIEVEENDKHTTAFTAGALGFYEYNVMPMGLTNSPATFQRVMKRCMGELQPYGCLVYLDDLVVHSTSVSEYFD